MRLLLDTPNTSIRYLAMKLLSKSKCPSILKNELGKNAVVKDRLLIFFSLLHTVKCIQYIICLVRRSDGHVTKTHTYYIQKGFVIFIHIFLSINICSITYFVRLFIQILCALLFMHGVSLLKSFYQRSSKRALIGYEVFVLCV